MAVPAAWPPYKFVRCKTNDEESDVEVTPVKRELGADLERLLKRVGARDARSLSVKLGKEGIYRGFDLQGLSRGTLERKLVALATLSLGEVSAVMRAWDDLRKSSKSFGSKCGGRFSSSGGKNFGSDLDGSFGSRGQRRRSRSPRGKNAAIPNALWQAVEAGDEDLCRRLLSEGADVSERYCNWTPLMKAAELGFVGIAEMLLDMGCDLNAVNRKGRSALSFAAAPTNDGSTRRESSLNVIEVLLDRKADLNQKDKRGETVLERALKEKRDDAVSVLRALARQ